MTLFDNRCFETVEVDAVDQVVTEFVDKHVEKNLGFVSHSYQQNLKPILLSLSGGVDSMVIFEILHKFKIPFRCIHIDYANRPESGDEAEYLQSFCKTKSVHFKKIRIPFKRDDKDLNRNQYETLTRQMRFENYRNMCNEMGTDVVCLGHHDDDIIENIICNIFQLQSNTDLGKIHEESWTKEGLIIKRPLIGLKKSDIYKYARVNDVFFFQDSTPKWSKRGQIRDAIVPCLAKTFPAAREQLLRFNELNSSNARLLEHAFEKYVRFEVLESIEATTLRIPVDLKDKSYLTREIAFWKHIFKNASKILDCEEIHHKSLLNFMHNLKMKAKKVTLSKQLMILNDGGYYSLIATKK